MASGDISEDIIEALYAEALVLADDARAAFDLRHNTTMAAADDLTRVALSIEGLRTTTRVMHVLAWLLNQRAFFSGELSERQLRRHNALPDERGADEANLALLEPETRLLIRESERLHARVARIDADWRAAREAGEDTPVHALQGRLAAAFGTR